MTTTNRIKVKWLGDRQEHPVVGVLEHGQKYDVPEDLGKAWCDQGAAEPESAEAHKVTRGPRREKE
jgi:hypothetical protein